MWRWALVFFHLKPLSYKFTSAWRHQYWAMRSNWAEAPGAAYQASSKKKKILGDWATRAGLDYIPCSWTLMKPITESREPSHNICWWMGPEKQKHQNIKLYIYILNIYTIYSPHHNKFCAQTVSAHKKAHQVVYIVLDSTGHKHYNPSTVFSITTNRQKYHL